MSAIEFVLMVANDIVVAVIKRTIDCNGLIVTYYNISFAMEMSKRRLRTKHYGKAIELHSNIGNGSRIYHSFFPTTLLFIFHN